MTQPGIFNRAFTNAARLAALLSFAVVHYAHAAGTGMGLIPCDGSDADPCTLNSVLQLMNNLLTFFFQYLLIPLFVVMVMYLGFSYLTAEGKPGQHAKLGSMAKHMILGLLLMLCAWVIVRTILSFLGYQDDLFFFAK